MVPFDLYAHSGAGSGAERSAFHAPGDVVELDGIDGFFDQYFEGRREREIIHFVSVGSPGEWPTHLRAWLELPFFSAEIVENGHHWARAQLCEVSRLGEWSLSRDEPPVPLSQLSFPFAIPPNLHALAREAQTSGSAYWHSDAQHRRSLSEVTAIGALPGIDSTALWVFTTNAVPSYFARVTV